MIWIHTCIHTYCSKNRHPLDVKCIFLDKKLSISNAINNQGNSHYYMIKWSCACSVELSAQCALYNRVAGASSVSAEVVYLSNCHFAPTTGTVENTNILWLFFNDNNKLLDLLIVMCFIFISGAIFNWSSSKTNSLETDCILVTQTSG